nr:hypothetical protein [Tanacetum cinerariifolium]
QVAFCCKTRCIFCKARCVLLQDSLRFASMHLAFCFKSRCVLLQSSLHFASRHAAFCFKTSRVLLQDPCVLSQDSCVLSHGGIAFCLLLKTLSAFTSKDNEDPSWNTSFKTKRSQKTILALEAQGKGIVKQDPSETPLPKPIHSSQQSSKAKDKGKAKMIEPKKPLKRKEQIIIDEEVVEHLEAQTQAELEEEERLTRLKEEETNIALVAYWDNTQSMMDAYCELARRLQEEERGQFSIEEKSKLFVELIDKRKKYIARLRAEKIRSKPPTKA